MSTDTAPDAARELDPITVEVIGAALESIVEETGEALIRASYSTNIKERRDCSTALFDVRGRTLRSEEHTSELQSLMRISYAVFCLKKKKKNTHHKKATTMQKT